MTNLGSIEAEHRGTQRATKVIMKAIVIPFALFIGSSVGLAQNLITNSSFENDSMQLQCDGWHDLCGDELTIDCNTDITCLINFFEDSPSAIPEESWCLQLSQGWPIKGFAESYVTGITGANAFRLTCWVRSDDIQASNTGYLSIGIGSQSTFIDSKTVSATSFDWVQLEIRDTLTTEAEDTITVRLASESCDICPDRKIRFDLIELTLETTTSSQDLHMNGASIRAFPNPTSNNITLEVLSEFTGSYELSVFDINGQEVLHSVAAGRLSKVDTHKLPAGIYVYQARDINSAELVGWGRFVKR